jgi:uncharacterized protein (TIGR00369 family)
MPSSDQTSHFKQAQAFFESLPYSQALGLRVTHLENGTVDVQMPYNEALIGDPDTGVIHGGAVSGLMDTSCAISVMSHEEVGTATATIDLRIDYMRSAAVGQAITARAVCYHVASSVAFVRAEAHDGTSDVPVATASGVFTVERGL